MSFWDSGLKRWDIAKFSIVAGPEEETRAYATGCGGSIDLVARFSHLKDGSIEKRDSSGFVPT
jgi:hypothetical protein